MGVMVIPTVEGNPNGLVVYRFFYPHSMNVVNWSFGLIQHLMLHLCCTGMIRGTSNAEGNTRFLVLSLEGESHCISHSFATFASFLYVGLSLEGESHYISHSSATFASCL